MNRVQGNGLLIECVNLYLQKYIVRWDVKPVYVKDEETGEDIQQGYEYFEKWLSHKPTIEEVKDIVLASMNEDIDMKILSGFEWNGMAVWLSSENQFNYKAAYDLAVQTGGANLPVMFKFGTTEKPVYHTFESVEELTEFYVSAMAYINNTLNDGWMMKDAMDWSDYELLLNPPVDGEPSEEGGEV